MGKYSRNVRDASQGYRTTNYNFSAEFAGNKKELPDCMYKSEADKQRDIKARLEFHDKYKSKNSLLAQTANTERRFKRVVRTKQGIIVLNQTSKRVKINDTVVAGRHISSIVDEPIRRR